MSNGSSAKKRIAVVGASGFMGRKIVSMLDRTRYDLVVVGRSIRKLETIFPDAEHLDWDGFRLLDPGSIHAVINLAGANVAEERWTEQYKQLMEDSRISSTEMCSEFCARNPSVHLINASAVSAYGFYTGPFRSFTEKDADEREGDSYLQGLIDSWEQATLEAQHAGNPVTMLRTGVILDPAEAVLEQLAKPFKFFVGGKIGTGNQVMSWISIEDSARAVLFLLEHPEIQGPVNLTSPGSCTNKEFAKALGAALGRPSVVPMPGFAMKAIMGQAGDELVLKGQRVLPVKLESAGFVFKDTSIETYLKKSYA